MKTTKLIFALTILLAINACTSDNGNTKDTEKPEIEMAFADAFPTSCATVSRGTAISFKAMFKDNQELGAYSINIHQNFDHHSHDTETDNCELEPQKIAVNPLTRTLTFEIPANQKEFLAEQEITIPTDIDTGDYHFMIQLTDAQGWATMRGISIKIID